VSCGVAALGITYPARIRPAPPAGIEALQPGFPGPPLARRAVVVVVDGARADRFAEALRAVPGGSALLESAAVFQGRSGHPSLSRPMYATIGSGATPRLTGVATNAHRGALRVDHLVALARRAGIEVLVRSHAVTWWWDLYEARPEERFDDLTRALAQLRESRRALALLHLVDGDRAGHQHGGASEEYAAALRSAAKRVLDVVASLDLRRDFLLVTADHGHRDRGGHGGQEPEVVAIPWWMAGRGVRPGTYGEASLVDVAPTVSVVAGLPLPAQSEGRPLHEALALAPAEVNRLARGWLSQRWRLASAVLEAQGAVLRPPPSPPEGARTMAAATEIVRGLEADVERAFADRRQRAIWLRALMMLPIFLLPILLAVRRRISMPALAVACGAAALYWILWWAALPFSISAVRQRWELYLHLALLAFATQAVAVVLSVWLARRREDPRLAGDAGLWSVTLAAVEVAGCFAWTGIGFGSDLPSPAGLLVPGLALARLTATLAIWGGVAAPLLLVPTRRPA
jgi:hypothetical protein